MLKIYKNIYLKGYKSVPYQKFTGRTTLLYTGKIICGVDQVPADFNDMEDLFINCECDFAKWKTLKKIFKRN